MLSLILKSKKDILEYLENQPIVLDYDYKDLYHPKIISNLKSLEESRKILLERVLNDKGKVYNYKYTLNIEGYIKVIHKDLPFRIIDTGSHYILEEKVKNRWESLEYTKGSRTYQKLTKLKDIIMMEKYKEHTDIIF